MRNILAARGRKRESFGDSVVPPHPNKIKPVCNHQRTAPQIADLRGVGEHPSPRPQLAANQVLGGDSSFFPGCPDLKSNGFGWRDKWNRPKVAIPSLMRRIIKKIARICQLVERCFRFFFGSSKRQRHRSFVASSQVPFKTFSFEFHLSHRGHKQTIGPAC